MIKRPDELTLEKQLEACRKSICRMRGGEDLYQQVCLRCIERAAKRDWHEPQYGFIHRIARRIAIDMRRREVVREPISAQSEVVAAADDAEPVDYALEQEGWDLLIDRLDRLPKWHKDVLSARYLHDESTVHISRKRHLPVDTVKTRIRRGLEKLRNDPVLRAYFAERN